LDNASPQATAIPALRNAMEAFPQTRSWDQDRIDQQ